MLRIIEPEKTKLIKDRYRPLFCDSIFYKQNQNLFAQWIQLFKELSSVEKVQSWVIALSLLRRPTDWFGGIRKQPFILNNSQTLKNNLTLKELIQIDQSPIQVPTKLQYTLNLFDLINQVSIKALPDSCLRSLTCLTNQSYPLEVIQKVPTPMELLSYQIKGKRIVSYNENYTAWPDTLYHGRDFLSFIIHDLIHADHFFSNCEHRAGQLGFYRCIDFIMTDEYLKNLLLDNSFQNSFEYIISDMNSHPIHLFKTLHACLQKASPSESFKMHIWNHWSIVWSRQDLTLISALQKINTQLFSDKDALALTSWCIALGQN